MIFSYLILNLGFHFSVFVHVDKDLSMGVSVSSLVVCTDDKRVNPTEYIYI